MSKCTGHEVPATFVRQQIDSVMQVIWAYGWKTGMLANAAIMRTVAERAGSMGEEASSMAMLVMEHGSTTGAPASKLDLQVFASDLTRRPSLATDITRLPLRRTSP